MYWFIIYRRIIRDAGREQQTPRHALQPMLLTTQHILRCMCRRMDATEPIATILVTCSKMLTSRTTTTITCCEAATTISQSISMTLMKMMVGLCGINLPRPLRLLSKDKMQRGGANQQRTAQSKALLLSPSLIQMHRLRRQHLLGRWPSVEEWRKTEKISSKVFISLKWLCKQDVEIWKQVFHFIIFSPKPYGRNLFRDKPRHFVPVRTLTQHS